MTLLARKVQNEFKKISLPKIVETLSELELAVIKYEGSKRTIKKIVDVSKEAEELSKFLELEACI